MLNTPETMAGIYYNVAKHCTCRFHEGGCLTRKCSIGDAPTLL